MNKAEIKLKIERLKIVKKSLYEKYKAIQDEIKDLMQELYKDDRVHTNGERARDVRLDRITGHG